MSDEPKDPTQEALNQRVIEIATAFHAYQQKAAVLCAQNGVAVDAMSVVVSFLFERLAKAELIAEAQGLYLAQSLDELEVRITQ